MESCQVLEIPAIIKGNLRVKAIPMEEIQNPCPCCSGKTYEQCCKPFHTGLAAENAVQLMRSRFSAYVLNLPDYIIATTHPGSPHYSNNKFSWKRSISQFSKNSSFHQLEVLDHKERDTVATVTFTAHLTQNGEDGTFTENSFFEKLNGRWYYREGTLEEGHAPNMVTIGQLRVLPLAYYGDAVLRKKADPIGKITPELEKLIEDMVETMDACNGMGLAAPQVHHSIRLFIIRPPVENEEGEYDPGKVTVFINPTLSLPSKETWKTAEGCLSIPAIRSEVERPSEITVEYTTLDGTKVKERFTGWQARIIMHENDHINGVLFVDRLNETEREKLAPILQSLEQRIRDHRAL